MAELKIMIQGKVITFEYFFFTHNLCCHLKIQRKKSAEYYKIWYIDKFHIIWKIYVVYQIKYNSKNKKYIDQINK